jgi:hypothetical protein
MMPIPQKIIKVIKESTAPTVITARYICSSNPMVDKKVPELLESKK